MSSPILSFEDVNVNFNEVPVLKNFSETVNQGEFFSLIGPNGSGKSTLINTLMGTVKLASGNIYLDGKNIYEYKAKNRARIAAVVPQKFYTSFDFKVYDIVMMGRNPYRDRFASVTQEDVDQVEKAMRITDVYKYKERKITSLSGGECQRVVIAAALAQTPKLLILDEPTNHLDLYHSLDIMRIIKMLNKENGLTVFAVLHDINSAARFSDRIAIIKNGLKINSGPVNAVLEEKTLREVYNIELVVRENDILGAREIIPIRSSKGSVVNKNKRIHVIPGGGSAALLIEALHSHGYTVSCGVVNEGDSDYQICISLGLEIAREAPYSYISDESVSRNKDLINEADAVILTDTPIGNGNLKNVEILKSFDDKKIYLVDTFFERDYTAGKAKSILDSLILKESVKQISRDSLIDLIEQEKI